MLRNLLFLLLVLLSASVFAQQATVSGTVKDSANVPLVGVTVVQKGTNNGKITDINGKFSLTVPDQSIIVFSMIGYTAREVTVNGSADINITLSEAVSEIEQVVVIGYGTVKKKDITTSVAVVSTKDLQERPMSSAASAIQGKAAGVMVMSPSGEPGAGLVVRIRGNTSINASNDPLYVVDGVPMNEIGFLSPNDIESMQILKDASSAAIYGSRAANGVVLITTKNGKQGRNVITFNSSLGFNKVQEKIKSLNTQQYKDLMDEIGAATIPEGLTDQTDWFDETYRLGTVQNYQVSFTGGNDKMNYYLSGGYLKEVGVIKVAYFSRYNFKANFENQIRSWLKVGSNIAYSDYANNGIISGTGSNRAGVILSVINTPKYAPIWDPDHPGQYYNNFYGAQVTHPVENMSRTEDDRNDNNRLIGSLSGDFKIASWLNFKSTMAIDRGYNHGTTFLDPKKTSYGRSLYGNATDNRSLNTVMTFDNIITADKVFGKHTLGLVAGTSWTTSKWSLSYMGASHFLNAAIKTLNAGNKIDPWGTGTTASNWNIMSYLGRFTYNFDSKYLLTANFRADGSSKLAPGHKWGYFPSFSAAWRISAEPFMQNISWLHDLKLRGGWGQTGNQSGLPDYGYLELYDIDRIAWWDLGQSNAVPSVVPNNIKNVDLTWETTSTTNIGLDLSMLKGRVNLAADAYYKYTKNLLFQIIMVAPWNPILRNEGEMSNRGIEFSLNTKNFVNHFKWETDFNISFNRNKVEKFHLQPIYYFGNTSEATSEKVIRMTPGQPLSKFWGLISDGVDPETGNMKYRDINHDGRITLSDKTYIGDPNPDFIYGMTNNFSWKGISLMILLQGSQGNDIFNASRMETEGMYDAKNQSTKVLDRWRRPGQITYMPRATKEKDNLFASTRFVEDGSYLRVKTLTLSYMYTGKFLKKIGFSYVQPYFTAENLITFTNYTGFDPEVNQYANDATVQGIDWGTYPHSKSYVFGLNFEF
jgi:TonB-dependent starch-binding outer membrane protein SusC